MLNTASWDNPWGADAAQALGALSDVPAEMFRHVVTSMPLESVAMLAMSCRSLAAILQHPSSPYSAVLPRIAHALMSDVGDAHILDALGAIEAMPLAMRASSLRTFTSRLIVGEAPPDMGCPSLVFETCVRIIDDTWKQSLQDVSLAAGTAWRVDLDVAAWHAYFVDQPSGLTDEGVSAWSDTYLPATCVLDRFESDFSARLRTYPSVYWPELLDASVARRRGLPAGSVNLLIEDDAIGFPSVTDRLALALANGVIMQTNALMTDPMRRRFGISDAQCTVLLHDRYAKWLTYIRRSKQDGFGELWKAFPGTHPEVVALTEQIEWVTQYTAFYRNVRPGAQLSVPGVPGAIAAVEATRWWAKAAAGFHAIEHAAHASLRASGDETGTQGDLLIDAYLGMQYQMQDRADALVCLDRVWSAPVSLQPALLDRWAILLQSGCVNHPYAETVERIAHWRVQFVTASCARGEHANAVRAYAAQLRVQAKLLASHRDALAEVAHALASAVFDTMPLPACGAMVTCLVDTHLVDEAWMKEGAPSTWIASFLKHPDAFLPFASPRTSAHLCHVAGPIFPELPDRQHGPKSKFARFCSRFAIQSATNDRLLEDLVCGLGSRIPPGTAHLRSAIRQTLREVGLYDDVCFLTVLTERRAKRSAMLSGQVEGTRPA